MFRITHPDPTFEIIRHEFKNRSDADAHMALIRKYTKEWLGSGFWTQQQADEYLAKFGIEETNELSK